MAGQDMAAGTRNDGEPPAGSAEARRSTEQVKLRLRHDEALALRTVAAQLNLTVSGYVASLAATGDASIVRSMVRRDQERLADVSRLAAATAQVPDEVRRLRGDLLRLGGLVKSLFIREESVAQAERFSFECAEALRQLTDAAAHTDAVVGRIEDRLQFIRYELEQTALKLYDDR